MTVTVPAYNPGARTGGYYITVITNSGLTFTMDPTVTVVQNGGSTGSGGGAVFYIEAGGSATNNGSGGDSYYVKSGGSVGGSGGGGDNVAYVEPGATVTLPGATVVPVAQITPSPVSALFQLLPPLPVPTTGGVSNVATGSATVSGTVNPEGYRATAYFEYGTDLTYGSQTAAQIIRPVGNQTTAMSANLTNLQPNTLYHYQLVATNTGGTGYGGDQPPMWSLPMRRQTEL